MNLLRKLFALLPLKLKRRINKKLVSVGLKDAPAKRVRKVKKSATSPSSTKAASGQAGVTAMTSAPSSNTAQSQS